MECYFVEEINDMYVLLNGKAQIKFKYHRYISKESLMKYLKKNVLINYTNKEFVIGIKENIVKNTIIYDHYYFR
jgi:hypothetical protein